MMQLVCVVVGVGTTIKVEPDGRNDVASLVAVLYAEIEKRSKTQFDSKVMKLYLARSGADWISDTDALKLKRGELPLSPSRIFTPEHEMKLTTQIGSGAFAFWYDNHVDVLVVLPDNTQKLLRTARYVKMLYKRLTDCIQVLSALGFVIALERILHGRDQYWSVMFPTTFFALCAPILYLVSRKSKYIIGA